MSIGGIASPGEIIASEPSRAQSPPIPRAKEARDKNAELNIALNGAVALAVFLLGVGAMVAAAEIEGPIFHTILDTSVVLVTAVLALLFWDSSGRTFDPFPRLLAWTFVALTACEIFHAMAAVEAAAGAAGSPSEVRWRAGTWGPAAHLLPISLAAILLMPARYRRHTGLFALGLLLLTLGLIAVFQALPRYTPGTLGITRPSLIFAPLLWAAVGFSCWRLRHRDPITNAIAVMSVIMVLAYSAMLFSRAPNDMTAMVAHWGKLVARFFLLMSLVQMGAVETVLRIRAERDLKDRNEELQAAVKELESFSYSVSHDLRAPLRSIDAFSQILQKEYMEVLPEDARGYLQRVRDNTARMGRLVDDLLRFSRLGRQQLTRQRVETSKILEQVLHDSRQHAGERRVSVTVGEIPSVSGDPALLRQVFTNLVDNAFKYTRMRTDAAVEIGSRDENGEKVFFVRDNGAGFDMQYADKLFGVFQRLHRAEDFEGTGVGLAIVHRIIERHGGRIWADAAVGRGATFYFTTEGRTHV